MIGDHAKLLTNLKNTSITIGDIGSKLATETEQGKQFVNPLSHDNKVDNDKGKNLDIKNYLKGHHFELGSKKNTSLNVQSPKTVMTG